MPPTPQRPWPLLNARAGADVWVKHENHAPSGSFKVRGGLVYFDALARAGGRVAGVVAATRGNHGQSIGFAARRAGIPAAIVAPHGNSRGKNDAMRALGVELIEEGHDFQDALDAAARLAAARGWHMVPSFDERLVLGVASYSLEWLRGAPPLDLLYVPIGLGSGICGVIAVRDALGLATRIVGVVSASAPAYARSLALGHAVSCDVTTRIADGIACRTPHPDALAQIRRGVERVVEVTDDQIEAAMRAVYDDTHNVVEGAAASSVAAMLAERDRIAGKAVGVVFTGANVDRGVFARVLSA